jgi:translation initiation factor 1 (eIF-1/SUI1)
MAKKKSLIAPTSPAPLSSLAELLKQRGVQIGSEQTQPLPTPPLPAVERDECDWSRRGKIVVRRERKGHGGKTVTVIDGLGLTAPRLESLARTLRIAFGCGSRIDGGRVILQGDLASGVEAWLRKRGARQVVIGN